MAKVLLIEDNDEVRENTGEILELARYDVASARNGKEGVSMALESPPDIIVCDIMMPELDGFGVLHILSKDPKTSSVPFIFLTAKADRTDIRKGMTLGADDYLTKPFEETELLNAIETRLRKSEVLRKEYERGGEGLEEFISDITNLEMLAKLSESRKTRIYKKKNNLFLEGDTPISVYHLLSGKIKTYKTNREGKEFITGLHGPGDFIGFVDHLKSQPFSESAMAMEDSEVSLIPKDDFLSLIHNNREVAAQFIKILSNNVAEKEEQLLQLAYDSVRQRVAEALLTLHGKLQDDDKSDTLYISREDLANMVGTAPESVIRTLSDFREEEIIDIESSRIIIKSIESLRRVTKGFVR